MPPAAGQDQTLAIVSLVLGIMGIVMCGGLTGPIAIFLGMKARKNVRNEPMRYGGDGLALAGIITGIFATLILLFFALYFIFVFGIIGLSILSNSAR